MRLLYRQNLRECLGSKMGRYFSPRPIQSHWPSTLRLFSQGGLASFSSSASSHEQRFCKTYIQKQYLYQNFYVDSFLLSLVFLPLCGQKSASNLTACSSLVHVVEEARRSAIRGGNYFNSFESSSLLIALHCPPICQWREPAWNMDSLMLGEAVEDKPDVPDSVLQNLLLKVRQVGTQDFVTTTVWNCARRNLNRV